MRWYSDRGMDEQLQEESDRLARSWMQHDEIMLSRYLVAGVEDPRINVQSILTRHFLLNALFSTRFEKLMEQELRFALVMNWLRRVTEEVASVEDSRAIRHALATGADQADGWVIPRYIAAIAQTLPAQADGQLVPDYLLPVLDQNPESAALRLDEHILNTFERLWAAALAGEPPRRVSVLEPACGSANDYRFLHAYGLAPLIEYTGLDLCPKNVANAQRMFPSGHFKLGNVFALKWPDAHFEFCVVHDLFEHLSVPGLERALAELCRVTRQGLSIGFFNLHEAEEHVIRPTEEYHWNMLSVPKLRDGLQHHGFQVRIIHVDTFLKWRFGCDQTHNKNAYTFFAERS
jgi:SAM-dependent methyltransferase